MVLTRTEGTDGFFYYISTALMLVADQDRRDDMLRNESYSGSANDESEFDGTDDIYTDKTLFSPKNGKLYLTHSVSGTNMIDEVINVCDENLTDERILKVKLNIVSLINPDTGYSFIDPGDLIQLMAVAQKTYSQACIEFVDKIGNSLDPSDVFETDAPDGVDISVGLYSSVEGEPSMDEQAIMGALGDNDPSTIDIFIVNSLLNVEGEDTHTNGETFRDQNAIFIAINSVITYQGYFGIPHEIGHVLTNREHFGIGYATSASGPEKRRNLMRPFGTTEGNDALYSSRRLTDDQIGWIRGATIIPYHD